MKNEIEEARRILDGMAVRQTYSMEYTDKNSDETARDVTPLVILLSGNWQWGFLAWCSLRNDWRWFLLTGIRSLRPVSHVPPGPSTHELAVHLACRDPLTGADRSYYLRAIRRADDRLSGKREGEDDA